MKCILCGKNKFTDVYSSKNWKVITCQNCNLVSTTRDKDVISYDFYHRDSDYKKLEKHFRNIFQKRVNLVNKFIKTPGKVLDVGCSNGVMLDIFKDKGWETWGIEPSENAEYAIDKGHKIFQTLFEKVSLPTKFNLIIMNHTLEHVDNPVVVLKKTYDLLEKNGIVLIDVPNFDSLLSNILKKNWPYLLPNEHTYHFTPHTLKKIFEKAGFNVVHEESRSGIFEFANPVSEIKESFMGLKKRFAGHLINLPYDLLATIINKGDSMSMVGRK